MKAPQNTRTTLIEGGGMKLKNQLVRPDPFPKEHCGREECSLTNCRERCYQAHVNYNIICKECDNKDNEIKYVYMGESCRGCYNREKQHKEAYRSKSGFMWDHDLTEHNGKGDLKFEMELAAKDSDPLRRVIRESVRIKNAKKNTLNNVRDDSDKLVKLMNRKEEWFGIKTIQISFEQE